jgi:hypothetical protein
MSNKPKIRNLPASSPIMRKGGMHSDQKPSNKSERKQSKLTLKQYLSAAPTKSSK